MGTEPGGLRGKGGLGLGQAAEAGGLRNLDGLFPEPTASTLYDPVNWDSLVHYWPLDGNGQDDVGSADFTVNGSPSYTSAVGNDGVVFDGNDDELRTPISLPDSQVTISVWVNYTSNIGEPVRFADTNSVEVAFNLGNTGDPEEHAFQFETTNNGIVGNRGSEVSSNTKYHYVLRYDGSIVEFFVNNSVDSSVSATGNIVDTDLELFLGAIDISAVSDFTEMNYVDELMIFDTALSASEIDTLYQAGV
jgi:hypothetical protein